MSALQLTLHRFSEQNVYKLLRQVSNSRYRHQIPKNLFLIIYIYTASWSCRVVDLKLPTVWRGAVYDISWMITNSEKQNDKVVETSIVHLMQMYMFVIVVLQKSKYHHPTPSRHTSGTALGICKFLFLRGTTALWSSKESVQSVTSTMKPFGPS